MFSVGKYSFVVLAACLPVVEALKMDAMKLNTRQLDLEVSVPDEANVVMLQKELTRMNMTLMEKEEDLNWAMEQWTKNWDELQISNRTVKEQARRIRELTDSEKQRERMAMLKFSTALSKESKKFLQRNKIQEQAATIKEQAATIKEYAAQIKALTAKIQKSGQQMKDLFRRFRKQGKANNQQAKLVEKMKKQLISQKAAEGRICKKNMGLFSTESTEAE